LPDELVQPLFGNRSGALVVNIGSVRRTRRLPVDEYAESYGRTWYGRAHDQVKIAGVEAACDLGSGPNFVKRPAPPVAAYIRDDLTTV
jgi:hypothetical protein